jgi:alcohol dehydrogenase class IV
LEHRVKVSLRSDYMLPDLALVDPALTLSVPPAVTASTGLDAFTQCLEPYVSNRANPVTDALCLQGLGRGARSLRRVFEHGDDIAAREDLSVTSLCGGLSLANAKLGAVHGFAGPLGGMFPAPHGAVCARLLPLVMEVNVRALESRAPGAPALERYRTIAELVTGRLDATVEHAIAWVRELCEALSIPGLERYGVTSADLPLLIDKAARASSMQGNPIVLTPEELAEIAERAL